MRGLIVCVALLLSTPASAQLAAPLFTADGRIACIQGMTGIGRPPGGWTTLRDPTALGGWVLAETTGDSTDLHFPICVSPQIALRDFEATLRFKPVAGTREQAGGLIFRAQSATDYYVARASALDGTVRLYRMAGGRRSQLATKEAPVAKGEWHKLKVRAVGDSIEVWLDDKSLFTVNDRSLLFPGSVGVWSQSDSVVYFDSLLVSPPS